jgi:hypothetical protein
VAFRPPVNQRAQRFATLVPAFGIATSSAIVGVRHLTELPEPPRRPRGQAPDSPVRSRETHRTLQGSDPFWRDATTHRVTYSQSVSHETPSAPRSMWPNERAKRIHENTFPGDEQEMSNGNGLL